MSAHSDPIADMLTRIRNAQKAGHETVNIPASKIKISIAHILKTEGLIEGFRCVRDHKQGLIKLALKYDVDGNGAISEIRRFSSPSRRHYVASDKIPFVKNGFGIGVLSTSKGVMTDRDARKMKVGGEYICSVF